MNKFIEKYIKNKKGYEKLVRVLRGLLEEITSNNNLNPQAIQVRVKDEEALKKHLKGSKYKNKKISSINEIPDLAACRVIFYSKKDFDRFKEILQKEFKIFDIDDKMLEDGYKGCHFIASLGKKRENLTEYEKLSNLRFEIQTTLIFAHGWNEWEHDLFYKDKKDVKAYFPKQFEVLKKMTLKISEQLRDIQESWEDIGRQYEQAAQGKSVFSLETFKDLSKSDDNNEIYNRLNNLKNFVEEMGEFPATLGVEKFTFYLSKIIEKAQTNKATEEKTVFGVWPGKTTDDILGVILKLSSPLAYRGMDFVTNFLLQVYPKLQPEIQVKIEEWFKNFAEYKYHILKNQGYVVQAYFMNLLRGWKSEERKKYFRIICATAESMFKPEFEGTTQADYKTISFQRGGLGDDKNIKKIREDLIELLIKMYKEADLIEHKLIILKVLNKAMQTSSYGGKIRNVIKDNAERVVSFYNELLLIADPREIAKMEDSVTWAEKIFSKEKLEIIKEFWIKMESLDEYSIYRILVGYDRNLRLKENIGYEESEKIREEKLEKLVDEISDNNVAEWEERIISITEELKTSSDPGEYLYLGKFLQKIGEKKEVLALKLLLDKKLKYFRENIIAGLFLNKQAGIVNKITRIVAENIANGKLLYEITRAYWFIDMRDENSLKNILNRTKKLRKKSEKINIVWQLLLNLKFEKRHKDLILDIIKIANNIKYYQWTSLYFHRQKDRDDFFSALTQKEWDIIVETLVNIKRIDYHEEQILENILKNNPEKFTEIFRQRIIKENKKKRPRDYDAIPHKFHHLTESSKNILVDNSKKIVDDALFWFEYNYGWQASLFLEAIYPESDTYLEERIDEIISLDNKKKWTKYVLPFIRWHRGSNIEIIVRKTIEKLKKDHAVWNYCMTYLLSPGSTSGNIEDSIIADAHRKKLEMIIAWKTKNINLIEFKKRCIVYLEKQIKIADDEHRQQLAIMKRKNPVNK